MKPSLVSPVRSISIASILVAVSSVARSASDAPHVQALAPRHVDHSRMLYDAPGDGTLWARGASYKASFGTAGATYVPFLGAHAPRNYPHALSPDRASVGGSALDVRNAAPAVRDGDRVELDRGAFVERYDLAPQSVEQSFVFSSLPRGGDLVVHIPVASDLAANETDDGIAFSSELGRVTYGRATAIDANGRRAPVSASLEEGSITLRVDASFVATAALPLVVDPLVSTIFFPGAADVDDSTPDTAYDPTQNGWLVTWQETFSATDHDVYARFLDANGATLLNGTIDFTTSDWITPRCANLAAAQQFLVVAGVTTAGVKLVMGRTAKPNGAVLTLGSQFTISEVTGGDKINPDVGGDPFPALPSFYCVAYERADSSTDHRIEVRLVDMNSALVGAAPVQMPIEVGSPDSNPSVSKSDDTVNWVLTWSRAPLISHGDIWAAHISYNGGVVDGPFGITASLSPVDFAPCASSPIHLTNRSAITFGRSFGANRDIMIAIIDGPSVLSVTDLSTFEPGGNSGLDQIESSVDCNGQHFLVTYSEGVSPGPYTVYADDLALSGSTLELTETHVLLHQFGLSERRSNVCGAHRVNGPYQRLMAVYDFEQNPTDHDVAGALFDALEGGNVSPFCFGDGTQATACPCSNSGAAGHGCANASNAQGALLTISGNASSVDDTAVLHSSGMPTNATCIFLQGTTTNAGVVFGDGVRCAAGTLIRIGTKTSTLGSASYPATGDISISAKGAVPATGGTRAYQAYYRDANASFCTSSTFNISNGLLVDWAP